MMGIAVLNRVLSEREDLDGKRVLLNRFFDDPQFQELDDRDKALLEKQSEIMSAYSDVLTSRIEYQAGYLSGSVD